MTAWFEDLHEFDDAIRQNGGMAGIVCPNYPAETAMGIYRNNYRGNLRGALALAYPVILQIVGEAYFGMAAIRYIEAHPSKSGNLHDYGAELRTFLDSFPQALPYLADMAKLEWACHRAYFAADEKPFDIAALGRIEPENWARLRFILHPACQVVRSRFPIAAIWQAHQPGMPEEFHVDLDGGPQNALVSRKNGVVRVRIFGDAETEWLERIEAGAKLGAATDVTLDHHPDFDLQSLLADLVSEEILVDFELEPRENHS